VEGEAVERLGFEVGLHGLHKFADDGPVLTVEDEQREHATVADQLVGVGVLLDTDAHQLGFEAHLGGPVQSHKITFDAIPGSDDIKPVGHLPQDAPAELVVLLLLLVGLDA
jgi:hypothetical protein